MPPPFPPGTPALCRDCGADPGDAPVCPACTHRRIVRHPELNTLTIAHVDCDAFYASVEKRDRPELLSRPVIVGGGVRGVVSAACYIARIYGVRSAMPMFKALKACPDAVVIRPDFSKYTAAARQIRALMESLTPLVQPLSIDEAVLDLAGTQALHNATPAAVLARFALDVEKQVGVTISIGLARNRLMAKIAAGRDKPRGYCVIGQEAPALLAPEPVRLLPGIGPAFAKKLESLGITKLAHLQAMDEQTARRRLGEDGPALLQRARGEDSRLVHPDRDTKSISAETTFNTDLADQTALERELWRLSEKLANRLRASEYAAAGVVLKLKTAAFANRTRTQRLPHPTRLPDLLFQTARTMLAREVDGTAYRLIGIGAQPLAPAAQADPPDLADPGQPRRAAAQGAIDALRAKFGANAVVKGRGFK
ncbi:MAG: DNA polymerase IV [Alphaproteobacteria bacterium]|nr:DNA polymerase IV [Alphaproteobacteria bacterium]